MADKLKEHAAQITIAQQLATIVTTESLVQQPAALKPAPVDAEQAAALLIQLGLGGLQKKLQRLVKLQAKTYDT